MSNPTGNYSRIKTWGNADTILGSDLNAEFDNVLNNFNPEMLAGYSQNQAQMQTQTNPGAVGTESLATASSGELERLRFQIAALQGTTYWYQTPASTIAQLNSAIGAAALANRINSGLTTGTTGSAQPTFLLAGNTTNTVTLKATATPFSYNIAGTSYIISADTSISGLTVAPSSQNTATVNDLTLAQAGTQSSQILGENGTTITVSGMGTSVTAQTGNICAFKTTAGEYLLGRIESTTQIRKCFRGYFFNSSNVLISRGTLSSGDTLTLMKLSWIYANTVGSIVAGYTNPHVAGIAPTSPASGDYWFDTSANVWKIYNGTSWGASNATLIGVCIQDTTNTVATRSFDFFESYSDLNNIELFADSQNSGTVVRARYTGGQVNVYGTTLNYLSDYAVWDFSAAMDTGAQAASTTYYFYIDTNGRSWISKVAPFDRRADLKGYYHPGLPWRCLGYGYSNANTLLENVESFFRSDDASPVSNITGPNNNIILPFNILQREQVITLTGSGGAFTQVLPPPAQLRGKYLTFVRTDNNIATAVTLQSWGSAVATPSGTISTSTTPTKITGMSSTASLVVGQLISGPGIVPNSTLIALEGGTAATMSTSPAYSVTGGTFTFANAAGFSGTVGQQTNYLNYGINGAFTFPLYHQYEQVTVTSDGFAYFLVNHYIPTLEIQTTGTIAITSSGGGAVWGTLVYDNFWYRRVGEFCHWRWNARRGTTGTSGTGDYSWTLPTGLNINTDKTGLDATVWGTSTYPTTGTVANIGSGFVFAGGVSSSAPLVYPASSTTFKVVLFNGVSGVWAAGTAGLTTAIDLSFAGSFPVKGWSP